MPRLDDILPPDEADAVRLLFRVRKAQLQADGWSAEAAHDEATDSAAAWTEAFHTGFLEFVERVSVPAVASQARREVRQMRMEL